MTRKFWRWTRNETPDSFGSDRTLYLDGEISDETWYGDEVTPQVFKDELNSGKGNITLWINSPGGDVFAAAQIYNMLMDYPYEVTVKIDALAASAASVIAMAGTKVCMSPVAMLMVHNPATIAIGDSEEMQKAIDMLSEVKESIMNAYEIKSGLSRNKISKLMDAETWMNAKEAKKLGFADEILFANGTEPDEGTEGDDPDDSEIEMLFSRKAVTDSLISKLIPKRKPEQKHIEPTVKVADLEKRLSLLSH
jgi:ATP-dependent Clp protease protease subunit